MTARKPKMCPYHREVVDVSLGTGDPQAGAVAMAQHAYSEQSCRGEYDGKCNFKPEMVSQSYWDTKAEKAQQRREEREQAAKETVQEPQEDQEEVEAPEAPEVPQGPDVPIHEPEEVRSEAPIDNVVDVDFGLNEQLSEAPSAVGEPMSMAASTKEAEALKTVDVDAGSDTPEPKMDKRKWTLDNITWDVDAEMDGSPVPTRHQDIVEPTDYNNDADDGRFDQTDAVLEKQDVSQGEELSHAGQGGTFGNGSQASPVTSASDARPKAV